MHEILPDFQGIEASVVAPNQSCISWFRCVVREGGVTKQCWPRWGWSCIGQT